MSDFSVEAIVLGRNDDYEPNWNAKLCASLAYNRRLFEGSAVDFRVAFVEWNPPAGKPLLAPMLVETFPFVRVVVVDPAVHRRLCEEPGLQILINFSCNVALRSSAADYNLITGGDEFFSSALARRIIENGLKRECLYRAERVNVRSDLDFTNATPASLEDPANIVSVDASEGPPYTNACGDFLLLDRGTMRGLRGLDEGIRGARLHVDSRFAMNSMIAGNECEMLGRIYHINHEKSYRNNETNYPGREYRWDLGLPYVNQSDWGLEHFDWEPLGERILQVALPQEAMSPKPPPRSDSPALVAQESTVFERLESIRMRTQPERPRANIGSATMDLSLQTLKTYDDWGSTLERVGEAVRLVTAPRQWGYAMALPLDDLVLDAERWHWMSVRLSVPEGSVGLGFLTETSELVGERFVTGAASTEEVVPIPAGARMLIVRNAAPNDTRSLVAVYGAKIVSEARTAESSGVQ